MAANNAILRLKIEEPLPFTVADGTGIEKGEVCQLTDPRTASGNLTNGGKLAGICAYEKVANDTRTESAFYLRGWFDMIASGAVNIGDPVSAYLNDIQLPAVTASGANILGYTLEAASDNEIVLVNVQVGCGAGAIS